MTSFKRVQTQIQQKLKDSPDIKQQILVKVEGPTFWMTLNRPKRFNSFTAEMYPYFTELIQKANEMTDIKYIVITGAGGNFCSGNDLNNFMDPRISDYQGEEKNLVSKFFAQILEKLCNALIDSRKPIFGLCEGKVIGFAFTQLAMYDKVFATQNAQFMAPLVKIAQGPEMCSSYMFPKIFGQKVAQQMVIEGRMYNASELEKHGMIQKYPNIQSAKAALMEHLANLNEMEWDSYLQARHLFREPERDILRKINHNECVNLVTRWNNPKLVEFLMNYMQKQKEKKNKAKK